MSFVSQPVSFLFHADSHALQVVLCQINIIFHQFTQNMMNNFCQIYDEQFALIFVNLMQISHHILGSFVSQPVSFHFHPDSHALQVVLCQINIFCYD